MSLGLPAAGCGRGGRGATVGARPGAHDAATFDRRGASRRTLVAMTPPAIVALGSSTSARGGSYRISRDCRRVVAEAEQAAARLGATIVVFSGWSPDDGVSEAAQMRALWRRPA